MVHLAARVHQRNEGPKFDVYRDVNVDGTLHLARCAVEAGVRKFTFVSTILVHGRSNDDRAPFSERDVLTPRGSYGMSKAAAEGRPSRTVARDRHAGHGDPAASGLWRLGKGKLRVPCARGEAAHPAAVCLHSQSTRIPVGGEFASFILQRLTDADKGFEVFLVADQEQVSTPEFVERLGKAADIKPRMFPLPMPVLNALLTAAGQPEAYESLIGSLKLDLSKAAATGWRPPITLDEGLRRALTEPEM